MHVKENRRQLYTRISPYSRCHDRAGFTDAIALNSTDLHVHCGVELLRDQHRRAYITTCECCTSVLCIHLLMKGLPEMSTTLESRMHTEFHHVSKKFCKSPTDSMMVFDAWKIADMSGKICASIKTWQQGVIKYHAPCHSASIWPLHLCVYWITSLAQHSQSNKTQR